MTKRTLVICEKPTAARRIAQALDDGGAPEEFRERGVPYLIARRGSEDLIVVSALGHLFSIAQSEGGWTYPIFNYRWMPAYEADKGLERTRRFIGVIEKLALGASSYVSACDYDMEGSLIAYMALLNICGKGSLEHARRMKYSTLTDVDLVKAWENMSQPLDFTLIEAGRCRHEVDWLFGINLTRALTLSVKNTTGFYKMLSIGRVQGPALKFIMERELQVRTFVTSPFWIIKAETKIAGKKYNLEYEKPRIDALSEADEIEAICSGKDGLITTIKIMKQKQPPLPPFNLGDLQREAYHKLRYSPRTTLRTAERLYLNALISYPRTSSQRLPTSIDTRKILRELKKRKKYAELASILLKKTKLRPRQGRRDDPAHPAIHPTGKMPGRLDKTGSRIYDIICRRFMAAFGDPAVKQYVDAHVDVEGYLFHLKGRQVLERGWMIFYEPYIREKEVYIPSLREGQVVSFTKVEAIKRYTKPLPRFNPSSLLKLMENERIGTKATRTDIIDTLFKRGYVKGNPIEMTELGFTIVETLNRYIPDILSVDMTRSLEQDLELIQTDEASAEAVLEKAMDMLKPVLHRFKEKEKFIGSEIDEALKYEAKRTRILGLCPL